MAGTKLVGLDIGTTAVRAAELEFSGRGGREASLSRFAQVPLPPGAVRDGEVVESVLVTRALKQLWSEGKFTTKDVAFGVGNQRVMVRELDLPWMPLAQLKEALPFQVQDLLPVQQSDVLLDFYPTDEFENDRGKHWRGMLVAAQRETVAQSLLAVQGAGLRPALVDLSGFALLRALSHGELAQRTVAFVDIGASRTTVIVSSHGLPRLFRTLPSGGQSVTHALAAAVSISPQEADLLKREIGVGYSVDSSRETAANAIAGAVRSLVDSIRNTFVFYATSNPGAGIDLVVLTGGGAHLPGLGQYLSSTARLAVTLGDPIAPLRPGKSSVASSLAGSESLVALAIGLATGVAA